MKKTGSFWGIPNSLLCSCYTFRHKMHAPPSSMAFNRLRRGALRSEQTCSLTGAAYYMLAVLVAFFTAVFMVPANTLSFPVPFS